MPAVEVPKPALHALLLAATAGVALGGVAMAASYGVEPWIAMLAATGFIGVAIVAVGRPKLFVPLLAAAVGLPFLRIDVGGADFSLVFPMVAIGMIPVFYRSRRRATSRKLQLGAIAVVLSAFLSVGASPAPKTSLFWASAVILFAILWLMTAEACRDPKTAERAIAVLVAVVAVTSAYGLFASGLRAEGSYYTAGLSSFFALDPRLSKNAFSEQLAVVLPLAVVLVAGSRTVTRRIVWIGAALMIGLALILTLSRGGWLAGIAGLAVIFRRSRLILPSLLVLAVGWLLWFRIDLVTQQALALRLESIVNSQLQSTNALRQSQLLIGWDLFKSNWVLGTGLGAWNEARPDLVGTFNTYLFVLVNTGVIGGLAVLAFMGMVVRSLLSRRAVPSLESYAWLGAGAEGAVVAYLVRFLTIDSFYTSLPWFIMGVAVGVANLNLSARTATSPAPARGRAVPRPQPLLT